MRLRTQLLALMFSIGLLATAPARAQWAVIDVAAIQQMVQQILLLQQQINTARNHLRQAQDQYRALTGGRGMERLLPDAARNYLPTDWNALAAVLDNRSRDYGALAADLQGAIRDAAVLSTGEIGALPVSLRSRIEDARRSVALDRVLARQALAVTSDRFGRLQQLITAIGSADDPKAVMDLQARIQVEHLMLVNESTKLTALYRNAEAERAALAQQNRERAVRDLGSLRELPALGL